MLELPKSKKSYWLNNTNSPGYPELTDDIRVDVAIVGAGIAGLTTAYLLKQSGLSVAVIEKDTVGDGVSGNTTGKITSQHNLIYDKLQKRLGENTARIYGEANEAAISMIEEIVKSAKIECDFRHEDNYVYTTQESQKEKLKNEAVTAQRLGLPATYETVTGLPFSVVGAVRFAHQATFHIRKYLLGLAAAVNGDNCYVFEQSHVIGIRDGKPGHVKTKKAKVVADNIIVATNVPTFPLMARGTYCITEYPMQSYIVAGKMKDEIKGMYISPDSNHYSILPVVNGNDKLLLIGGEGHVVGSRWNPHARYERLAQYAEKQFGIEEIVYRWTHRDYLGYDDMPLVGKLYPWSKHTYTATGFMKWGLTNGTMAAMILRDQILKNDNPWAAVFDPHRFSAPAAIPKVIGEKLGLK